MTALLEDTHQHPLSSTLLPRLTSVTDLTPLPIPCCSSWFTIFSSEFQLLFHGTTTGFSFLQAWLASANYFRKEATDNLLITSASLSSHSSSPVSDAPTSCSWKHSLLGSTRHSFLSLFCTCPLEATLAKSYSIFCLFTVTFFRALLTPAFSLTLYSLSSLIVLTDHLLDGSVYTTCLSSERA